MRILARNGSLVWAKLPVAPPQQPTFVKIDETMFNLIVKGTQAAGGDFLQTIDNNVVREVSPERFPKKSNQRSDLTSPLRFSSNATRLLELAEKKELDSKMQCTTSPELHLSG